MGLIARIAVAVVLLLFVAPATADVTGPTCGIDGDPLQAAAEHIRLHGNEAPEAQQLCRSDGLEVSSEGALAATCCKVCRKGKACGDSCIARAKTCHQPVGCACDGN